MVPSVMRPDGLDEQQQDDQEELLLFLHGGEMWVGKKSALVIFQIQRDVVRESWDFII